MSQEEKVPGELTSTMLERLAGVTNQSHNRFVAALEAKQVLIAERIKHESKES